MKKFWFKLFLFFAPILIIVLLYFIIDPFKVLYNYSEQINTNKKYQIIWNRDFQSTELFLKNYKKYDYNSFIFGNSRSLFYQVKTWEKLVIGNCFHFNAFNESIYGINLKLKLLDGLKINIKNALIVLDTFTIGKTNNNQGLMFIKHPLLSKESYFTFHTEMFRGFFPKLMFAYIDYIITGKKKAYMNIYGLRNNVWKHDVISNQLVYYIYDQQIKNNINSYYSDKKNLFYKRDSIQIYSNPSIFKNQAILLESILSILKNHKTNYKIIINPLYDQKKINPKDLDYLKQLFGAENVYDFSGINRFTNDYHNYYETSHYRPPLCDSILNIVYN